MGRGLGKLLGLFSPEERIPPAGGENRGVAGVVTSQGDGVPGGVAAGVVVLHIPVRIIILDLIIIILGVFVRYRSVTMRTVLKLSSSYWRFPTIIVRVSF